MRRQFKAVTYLALLAIVAGGCGSTGSGDGNDATVLEFVGFDNTGLSQADAVLPGNAQVDIVQNLCETTGMGGGMNTFSEELFTQTVINAVFRNNQKLDIQLHQYTIHIDDPDVGVGDTTYTTSGRIIGGRCSNAIGQSCAVDQDCLFGGVRGNCVFTQTSLDALLLVDFDTKDHVLPAVYGRGLPVDISFVGSDVVGKTYRIRAKYTVTFDNFCNCNTGELCIQR